MRKLVIFLLGVLFLTGCGDPKVFETMSDLYYVPEAASAAQTAVQLPDNAVIAVAGSKESGRIYLCDGYTVAVQTLSSGNLDTTLRAVTGYARQKLQLMKRQDGDLTRYECAWVSAGEGGDQVARTVILDDGTYHYTLTVMGGAEQAGHLAQVWQAITDSFTLRTDS